MVQTFGKRVLGGIGAPGGGMSKAYAEGVNTGISQRMNRQSMAAVDQDMRLAEQDQQFKIEDREEAKRRRAAAAANAAAAKARNIATARAIAAAGGAGGVGSYWPGTSRTGLDTRRAPATRPGALSFGTDVPLPAPAPPAIIPAAATPTAGGGAVAPSDPRTAGLNTYDNMNISNIVDVQGTYGNQSTLQQRQAANTRAGVRTGLPIPPLAARPGNFAAQATQRTTAATALPAHIIEGVIATRRATMPVVTSSPRGGGARTVPSSKPSADTFSATPSSINLPELQRYRKSLIDRIVAETQAVQSGARRAPGEGDDVETLREMVGDVDVAIAQAGAQAAPRIQSRGITAEEGPGSPAAVRQAGEDVSAIMSATGPAASRLVTVYGPNGKITVPADEFDPEGRGVPPTLAPERANIPVPASPELGFGGAASPQTDLAGGTTYGGRLGAAPTPTEMFFADMGYTPAGQLDIQAIMADQTGPIKDPAFSQLAEQRRVMYMYAAEDAIANGDAAGYIDAQQKVKEQEMLILAQQVVAGADEALRYGSTERLNMAASMIEGVDIVFIPKGEGTVDVYVNGQLDDENMSIESIIGRLRMRVDDAYVKEMSAIAEEDRASQRTIYEANEIDRFETMMNMQEAEFTSMLATEAAREGEFDKLTAKVIEQKLIASGQLPSTSKNTVVKTDNGLVVVSEDGGIVTQYVLGTDDTGKLVAILE